MSKFDFRTPLIYILVGIILILLVLMRKMDQNNKNNKEQTLEKRIEQLETKIENVKNAQKKKIPKKPIKEKLPIYKGRIGIIIDDFGYRNDYITDGFLSLDADLTYAVIPGHEHSYFFGEKAKSAGYEVIVHMPMENTGKTYGEEEFVLKTDMDGETIERRIKNAFNQIPSAIGMNVDSRTTAETIGETTMKVFNVPTASRNIFLDNDDDEEKITQQLMKLVRKSEQNGFAIGIGHVKPKTLNVLKNNIPKLKKDGYKFEFVSKMLH